MTGVNTLAKLQGATNLHGLAAVLGYKPQSLSYLLYKMPPALKYTSFEIPKKNLGKRTINAPTEKLKILQRHLASVLEHCRFEIAQNNPRPVVSHGFRKSHSIITNARSHINSRYVLNIDLQDFFPSINFGRVRGFFLRNRDFRLNETVATLIAQIACHENSLPQGAPTSPIISDLIAHLLDVRLLQLAKKHGCQYSRYADDITFSTRLKNFPSSLAFVSPIVGDEHHWLVGEPLAKTVESAGFAINPTKTRMQLQNSKQTVTGLSVNKKVNIQASYYRTLRSMTKSILDTGKYHRDTFPLTDHSRIGGMLAHVFHVKREVAYKRIVDKSSFNDDKGIRRLYRTFLFYKRFVALSEPLIICEGKTDNVYLREAMRAFSTKFPTLIDASTKKFNVRFLQHTKAEIDVLKLGGGVSGMKLLARDYERRLLQIRHRPFGHPVILLADNDTKDVIQIAKEFGITITHGSTDPFYRLTRNLYLIKTPELPPLGQSCIEDLFEQTVKDTILDGKKFNNAKKIDPTTEYGKQIFAEKVVKTKTSSISFAAFEQLLNRVSAVIDDYKTIASPVSSALIETGAATAP